MSRAPDIALTPCSADQAAFLAELRANHAEAQCVDPISTMESLPSAQDLTQLMQAAPCFRAVTVGADLVGYAAIRWWDEDAGPRVILCEWYVVPELESEAVHSRILAELEAEARSLDFSAAERARSVIGVNASSIQLQRAAAIVARGYTKVFSQIEMQLTDLHVPRKPLDAGIALGEVTVADAARLVALTERVWAGREFFTHPTIPQFESWLQRSDLELFNLALDGDAIAGFVASIITGSCAEIDDVQVDPRYRRRGIASALVTHNIGLLRQRGVREVRLNTEAHDPAGARSLYERLGFTIVREYMRYRKPL